MALASLLVATSVVASPVLTFSDLEGWWCADPSHDGESSKVCIHFVEESGKQSARLTLPAIGGYDVPVGTVKIAKHSVDIDPFGFPLQYDDSKKTLRGQIPDSIAPVYKIPVEFTRSDTFGKPPPDVWDLPRPTIAWTFDTKSSVWAGLEHDPETNSLFVANDAGEITALDMAGKTRWTFSTNKPIKARPTVVSSALFVASDSGFLYRLDKRTGREQWRARIDSANAPRKPAADAQSRWDRYGSSAIADGQRVFVASRDKHLYALDIATGKEVWRVNAGDIMTATPALYRDMVIFAAFDGKVAAVSAADGKRRWTYDAKLAVPGDITIAGDRAYVGSRTYDLIALDAASGQPLWKRYYWFSWIESPAVVRDGVVYTGSSDALGIYAFDANTGASRWKARVPGWAWSRPAVAERLIVAGTVGMGGYLGARNGALVGIDRTTGTLRWMFIEPPDQSVVETRAEWGFAASPLIIGERAYAADLKGRVHAFALTDVAASASSRTDQQ